MDIILEIQHMMHVYKDKNHWDTQILYKSLNTPEIHHTTLSNIYFQLTVQDK